MSVAEHKHHAPRPASIRIAVVTVSDTRTPQDDTGGQLVATLCQQQGHQVVSQAIFPDEPAQVAGHLRRLVLEKSVDVVLVTGGTGISHRDSTVEAVSHLLHKRIDGYGELFRALSFADIGPAAMLSRAVAGTVDDVVVFTMPGSPAGARLALEKLILPELGHILAELHKHDHAAAAGHGHHHEHGSHKPHG